MELKLYIVTLCLDSKGWIHLKTHSLIITVLSWGPPALSTMLIAAKTNNSQPFKWQQRPCSYYVHACSYLVILVYTMWMLIHTIHACSYLSILCECLFMPVHICSYYVQCTCLSILVHAYYDCWAKLCILYCKFATLDKQTIFDWFVHMDRK